MRRRVFVGLCLAAIGGPLVSAAEAALANKRYVFTLRAPNGSVGNVTIVARDIGSASAKVRRDYPGFRVLAVKER
jgi:hypothetical protein